MHFIFDVETSGFLTNSYPFNHPRQGRILQVGALLLDEQFKETASFSSYIHIPDHVEIAQGAFEVNGITKECCQQNGIPIEAAIIVLDSFNAKSKYQCGHNLGFDLRMIHHEEASIFGQPRLQLQNGICTMEETTDMCKLVGGQKGRYKWPKLEEAYQYITGTNLIGSHDALTDCRAVVKIYEHLWKQGFLDRFKIPELSIINGELQD